MLREIDDLMEAQSKHFEAELKHFEAVTTHFQEEKLRLMKLKEHTLKRGALEEKVTKEWERSL